MDAKTRILNAAERLFITRGFEATSIRAITSAAGVNLASVNYHFKSKDALIHAVIARRLDPINRRRMELLDSVLAEAGHGPIPVEAVIEAFVWPLLDAAGGAGQDFPFGRWLGRLAAEPADFVQRMVEDHIRPVGERFFAAFHRAAPHLSPVEMIWRIHFVFAMTAHSIAAESLIEATSGGLCRPRDVRATLRYITRFAAAGWVAPPAGEAEVAGGRP